VKSADVASTSVIDEPWPVQGVEDVDRCPYCESRDRILAHGDVQDWSFYAARGKWMYWSCEQCQSLYLSPRPTTETMAQAYSSYYTHHAEGRTSLKQWLQERLRNEYWSHRLETNLRPRLHLPRALQWTLLPLRSRLIEPFEIAELARISRGRLLDVGCGNGKLLESAERLGWRAQGLEIDPTAVAAARARGLDVLEGSYERLTEFEGALDCIICSHVLEHVHEPLDLLSKLAAALTPGGTLLLASPNATSIVRRLFGNDWRGLEAPRHLSIPSMKQLENCLRDVGFSVHQRALTRLWTAAESARIRRRGTRLTAQDLEFAERLNAEQAVSDPQEYDFVEFICVKDGTRAR
jgi:2-polyprenyl-3-methyl-5-hydroxy-6-metoxy-1,4-benzoquinol methylase